MRLFYQSLYLSLVLLPFTTLGMDPAHDPKRSSTYVRIAELITAFTQPACATVKQKFQALTVPISYWCALQYKKHHKLYAKDFKELGVEYFNDLAFDRELANTQLGPIDEQDEAKAVKKGQRYSHFLTAGYEAPMHLRYVNEQVGYGVMIEKDLKKGSFVGQYAGIVCPNAIESNYSWFYPTMVQLLSDKTMLTQLDAQHTGNFSRFINHSSYPNIDAVYVKLKDRYRIIYRANQDIEKGSQLLVNYGLGYWNARGIKPASINEYAVYHHHDFQYKPDAFQRIIPMAASA